jgi:Flp pilus assembly protein TadD
MSVKVPPHRPTKGELDAAKAIALPSSDQDLQALFELAHRADEQGQLREALNLLMAAALARPDDWRIYEAFGGLYKDLGREQDAAACFSQAHELREATNVTPGAR